MHELTVGTDEWVQKWSLKNEFGGCPGNCREEVVGILGGGELGSLLFSYLRNRIFSSCFLRFTLFPKDGRGDEEERVGINT